MEPETNDTKKERLRKLIQDNREDWDQAKDSLEKNSGHHGLQKLVEHFSGRDETLREELYKLILLDREPTNDDYEWANKIIEDLK